MSCAWPHIGKEQLRHRTRVVEQLRHRTRVPEDSGAR
jgi:hypothetical protein